MTVLNRLAAVRVPQVRVWGACLGSGQRDAAAVMVGGHLRVLPVSAEDAAGLGEVRVG